MEVGVVMVEGLIALGVTWLAWVVPGFGPFRYFARGVPVGMAWCALIHGVCFGILRVDGGDPSDPMLLAAFGAVAAVVAGIPLGALLGLAFATSSATRRRRSMARFRKRFDDEL